MLCGGVRVVCGGVRVVCGGVRVVWCCVGGVQSSVCLLTLKAPKLCPRATCSHLELACQFLLASTLEDKNTEPETTEVLIDTLTCTHTHTHSQTHTHTHTHTFFGHVTNNYFNHQH